MCNCDRRELTIRSWGWKGKSCDLNTEHSFFQREVRRESQKKSVVKICLGLSRYTLRWNISIVLLRAATQISTLSPMGEEAVCSLQMRFPLPTCNAIRWLRRKHTECYDVSQGLDRSIVFCSINICGRCGCPVVSGEKRTEKTRKKQKIIQLLVMEGLSTSVVKLQPN